jgi:hypothetical protein
MTEALRAVLRYANPLVFLAVTAQIAGAAYGAFYAADKLGDQSGSDEQKMISEKAFDHGFGFHTAFGYIIFIAAVVLFLIALGARIGRPRIWQYLALPILVAVQIVLAWISEDVHGVGILHGINALVIFGLTGSLTFQQWRRRAVEADIATTGGVTAPG